MVLKEQSQKKSELAVLLSEGLNRSLSVLKEIIGEARSNKDGSKLEENLKLTDERISTIEGMVNNFLEISKIESGKMKLEAAKVDLRAVVSQVALAMKPLADLKGIRLDCSVPDCELAVEADHDRVSRVLTNLVSNSIRIAPAKSNICIRAKDVGKEIMVEVEDDGPAIEKGEVNKLFNGPMQAENLTRSSEVASVVGLYVVKELVELHSGSIWFENRDEQGNSFCFSLPKSNVQKVLASTA